LRVWIRRRVRFIALSPPHCGEELRVAVAKRMRRRR
jgi:hypothetical protein